MGITDGFAKIIDRTSGGRSRCEATAKLDLHTGGITGPWRHDTRRNPRGRWDTGSDITIYNIACSTFGQIRNGNDLVITCRKGKFKVGNINREAALIGESFG